MKTISDIRIEPFTNSGAKRIIVEWINERTQVKHSCGSPLFTAADPPEKIAMVLQDLATIIRRKCP